jgi:hypothetical protein
MSVLCDIGRIWSALSEVPASSPDDPTPIGYRRILEARAVRDLLDTPDLAERTIRQTEEFRRNFASFDLGANEGYVLSLIAGRLTVKKILMISTLGRFQTLFTLAKLDHKGVIVFSTDHDVDSTSTRRRP